MEEEFQAAGICGGNWWIKGGGSPCSMGDLGAYGSYWNMADLMVDLKPRSSCKDYFYNIITNVFHDNNIISSASGDHDSIAFQSSKKLQQQADSDSGDSSILMDSSFQMMGFNFSSSSCSSSPDWNQALIRRGENYDPNILQEEMNLGPNHSSQVQEDWTDPKTCITCGEETPSMTISPFKDVNQDFSLDHHVLNPLNTLDSDPTTTSQDVSSSSSLFLTVSSTYNDYPSTLIQSFFEADPPQPQQQTMFNDRTLNYCGTNNNWSSEPSTSCWPYNKLSYSVSNNTPLWNASSTSSSQPHFVVPTLEEKKPTENKLVRKSVHEASGLVMKKGCEPILKRPRIESPSPLPTFKVRKEKMGDRITALQQLVSPFGKTDTASVLHEAIEYIKFLHDQVNVLGAPYLRNDNATQRQQVDERMKDPEGPREDLRSRGLCLVPISSTISAANESFSAFWTPTFGSNFK